MCSSVDVLLPGTLVNHCVSFHGCSGFCIMPKEVFARIFCAKCYGFARHGTSDTIPVLILAYVAVIFWFIESLELMNALCIAKPYQFDIGHCASVAEDPILTH